MNIRRTTSIVSLIVFAVALVWAGTLFAQGSGYGPGGGDCPGWQGKGSGMGPGMMGQGSGMGPGMRGQGYGPQYQQPQKPVTKSDAESMLQAYVSRNPNLKVGTVQDEGNSFEANVTTKDGSLVNKLFVDKDTGRIRSEY
jgi:hypothetical protein